MMINQLKMLSKQANAFKKPSELVCHLVDAMKIIIEQNGEDEDVNISTQDINSIQSLLGIQNEDWDNSYFTNYFLTYYMSLFNEMNDLKEIDSILKLVSEGSFYFQSMSLAMQDNDICEMMKGGITTQLEFNLWKDMALAPLREQYTTEQYIQKSKADNDKKLHIFDEIVQWGKKYNIKIDFEALQDREYVDSEDLANALVVALEPSGYFTFGEQGTPPDEYLPDVIRGVLSIISDREIKLECISSDDGWMTAKAILSNNENKTEIFIDDINNSDWVPPGLITKLEEYSRKNCKNILYTIYGEDPFTVLYLSDNAIQELESIRMKLDNNLG